ncbi:dead deah box helicase domain-containing protein [Cyclospora cayetanensis]|uniref:Dead deah box helicase domain-containing protein n=1 Tax=Cyclospora cayetanensis TaxID=88456 RepID=A0A1D3CWW8_9EIME|nr:dead deah box helicase domain-containing protein [Cyclospora cayetanensis]
MATAMEPAVEDLSSCTDSDGSAARAPNGFSGAPTKPKGKRKGASPFMVLGLSASVAAAASKHLGFRLPTPVQRAAIPSLLQGRNAVVLSRTGSGKTAAYLLPLAERLQQHATVVGARALIVAPSRELLLQIHAVAKKLLRGSSLILCPLIGGCGFDKQFEALAKNPDILLGTPGRLLQLQQDGVLQLQAVSIAVLDEADRMLELGWGPQLELLWAALPGNQQGVFVSATLPENLVSLARFGLADPVFVKLNEEGTLSDKLAMRFVFVRPPEKAAALLATLHRLHQASQQALVFVSTRHQAELLHALLFREGPLTDTL